ncbi:helix-turn-helix domain-containing protein [Actinoplanes friuliensis]|uniref:AraC family transcriptional regulator n=1 Tax=Actinoplanes friuliensis DSM 7358 TaxID=1246995 RepID=U5VWX4_9ACTN|nr:helix-turn-helix domain-containing protein [Actinoplanes friuliensis]AGZ41374.1 AraC family transcriptional regulator [Actinoplanes friuliensis DSM 7358]
MPKLEQTLPSRLLTSSEGLGWRSIEARTYADPPSAEAFSSSYPRLLLVLVTSGRYRIESRHGRSWRAAAYRPGSVGISAPGNQSELRWRSTGPSPMRSLHLHLDPAVAGKSAFPDALTVRDQFVSAAAGAVARALEAGAPALYADSLAQALVAHLAHRTAQPAPRRPVPALSDTEVRRVTDYMRARLADDISVEDLAAVVNVSKFHFIRTFALTTGVTPFRHLRALRLETAAHLLRTTTLSVARVAAACGYRSAGQFGAAFRSAYGVSPAGFRNSQ